VNDRLYRSRDDRMLTGVAGGVAELLDADPSLIRLVWAVLVVLSGGLALLVYVVMAIVVPERPVGMAPPGAAVAPDGSTVPPGTAPSPRAGRRTPDDAMRGGLIAGLLLIVIGGFFLLRQLIPSFDLGAWWPVAAIGLGIVLIVLAVTPSRHPD
jgi:phage shock protein C